MEEKQIESFIYPHLRNPSFIKANYNTHKGVYCEKKWCGEESRGVRSSVVLLGGFTGWIPRCERFWGFHRSTTGIDLPGWSVGE